MKTAKARRPSKRIHTSLPGLLAQLETAQLVRQESGSEPGYAFKHALTQDAAYASLLQHKLPVIHRLVAEAYVDLYRDQVDSYAGLIAHHFARAGDDVHTFEYARRAGDASIRVYANSEAVVHYSLALTAAQRLPQVEAEKLAQIYSQRGQALEWSSRFPEAAANYADMERAGQARHDAQMQVTALAAAATIRAFPTALFDPPEAHRLMDRALGLARALGNPKDRARLLWTLALVSGNSGQLEQSVQHNQEAIAIARALGLQEQLALSLTDQGMPLYRIGQFTRAEAVLAEARQLWRDLDNRPMLANNLAITANLLRVAGDYAEAQRMAEQAYEINREAHNPWGEVYSGDTLAALVSDQGEPDRAIPLLRATLQVALEHKMFVGVMMSRTDLAWALGSLGAWPEATQQAKQLRNEIWLYPLPRFFPGLCLTALSRLYTRRGDLQAAAQVLEELGYAEDDELQVKSRRTLARSELALARGELAAVETMESFCRELERTGARALLPQARHVLGRTLDALGQTDRALQELEAARALAAEQNARPVLWPVLADMGRIERARGRTAQASGHFQRARETILHIADHAGSAELRATFLSQPQVRDALAAAGDHP